MAKKPAAADTLTTAVHFPRRTWELLRAVAFHRAQLDGGRASVSKLLTALVEQQRAVLEREAKKPIE
jgi:hypothetical protein